jgi:hypothetical protein
MTAGKFSKLVVIFSILHLFVFTYVCVILQAVTTIEISPQLVISNFAFFGTELVGLLALKVFKVKKEDRTCQNSEINS